MLNDCLSLFARSLQYSSFLVIIFSLYRLEVLANSTEMNKSNLGFSGVTLPPVSGKKPDSIVVLFHGYGDSGENFIFLGAFLSEFLPNTLFVAPDGPTSCKLNASGKQWLSLQKNNQPQMRKEIKALTISLNQYLDRLLKKYDLPPEKMLFVGFSQGARVALHVGLRRPKCAGIVALSGSYLDDPQAMNLSRPPILIIHGKEDQKAPVSLALESYQRLETLKMSVSLILLPGIGHNIVPQSLQIAGEFLKDCLSGKMKG